VTVIVPLDFTYDADGIIELDPTIVPYSSNALIPFLVTSYTVCISHPVCVSARQVKFANHVLVVPKIPPSLEAITKSLIYLSFFFDLD